MNPPAGEVLHACVQNLEELVAPQLTDPHAKSALMCVRMLINHVILRLAQEGPALAADCAEKHQLFEGLLEQGLLDPALASEIAELLVAPEPVHTPIETLTARDEAWKRVTERALAGLGEGMDRDRIRRQLVTQVTRENAFCGPALDGPLF